MSSFPRCYLTARDFGLLEEMLEDGATCKDEAFLRLLRGKIAAATVVFTDDIDTQVATVNSRIEFRVNGGSPERRLLVCKDSGGRDNALSITTHWGLALLGLSPGEAIRIEGPDGAVARLQLERVMMPEKPSPAAGRASTSERQSTSSTVVPFGRRAKRASIEGTYPAIDPDNDPGPNAA